MKRTLEKSFFFFLLHSCHTTHYVSMQRHDVILVDWFLLFDENHFDSVFVIRALHTCRGRYERGFVCDLPNCSVVVVVVVVEKYRENVS